MQKEEKKPINFYEILLTHISEKASLFENWVEVNSTVNLVPFGQGITELQIHENCDFVVPVNILTTFARALFSRATRHTTVCLIAKRSDMYIKTSKL